MYKYQSPQAIAHGLFAVESRFTPPLPPVALTRFLLFTLSHKVEILSLWNPPKTVFMSSNSEYIT